MMPVFFFARLWRRAEIITDVELIELRYAGKPAAFLRGFRALYFGVLMNCLIVGWVNLAMEKILGTALGVSRPQAIAIIFGIIALTSFYTFISGLWGTLWFNIAHYAVRPWPWILTALASVVLYPNLADPEVGYIKVWVDYLPGALRGLMLAAFAAAYMSTIATQLNWGSSYLVNDFYRRFMV